MAHPQNQPIPFSGSKKDFSVFDLLLQRILAVAALPTNKPANILQLHFRDAAVRCFQ